MRLTSKVCASSEAAYSCVSLQTNHQRISQVVFSIILLAGITLSTLSVIGYLPSMAGYVSAPGTLLVLIALILVSCVDAKSTPLTSKPLDKKSDITQDLDEKDIPFVSDNGKLIVLEKNALQDTTKKVVGTGSGVCPIYSHNGIEYVLKQNSLIEFYAGRLYKIILGNRSPNIIFIKKDSDNFYVGSQFEVTYKDIWKYHRGEKKALPEADRAGLATIVVASFLLGEIDLKGLGSANSNVGIVDIDGSPCYFKIDHEESFLFWGDYWRADYVMDADWENKLWKYCERNRLTACLTKKDLIKAAQEIASIPLKLFEAECDSCEQLCREFPEILKKTIEKKTEDMLLKDIDKPKIKDSIVERIKVFQQLVLQK